MNLVTNQHSGGISLSQYFLRCSVNLFGTQGHSGSGKSAVVNMLSGLSRATSGEAYIYGLPVTDAGNSTKSPALIVSYSSLIPSYAHSHENL